MEIKCRYDKLVPVSELKPHPKNRNQHPQEQIDRLAKILAYQGVRAPIVISTRSAFIVKGHGTLMAMRKNGATEAPVVYQDFDSIEQEYAFLQSDNAIASWAELDLSGINTDLGSLGPDFDIDMLGIKDFVLEPADKLEPQCDEDEVPEQVEPKTKPGDIYQLGRHRLMCGDSTSTDNVLALLAGETAELCFTSPPYADQREYNGEKELSTDFLATFIRAAYGLVRYFAVNLGYSRKDGEVNPYWDDYIKEARECGLKLLSWNVWDKGQAGSIGNQNAMFAVVHEWVFVFGPSAKELNLTVPNKHAGEVADHTTIRQADGTLKKKRAHTVRQYSQMQTVLPLFPLKARNHDIKHPAMFPVEFPEAYIEAMTDTGDAVYEPFTGSGTTLIACEKTGRSCFGMELDPHYCSVIIERWCKFTGKEAYLLKEDGSQVPWSEVKNA